jgi:hypothetical protein
MMRVQIDGQILEGTSALEIVRAMREELASPWHRDESLATYMEHVSERFRIYGKPVSAQGPNEDARAEALLEGMIACGFARRL